MVADPVALQYVLNSPKFCRAPITDNIAFLLFGEKSVFTARGKFFAQEYWWYIDLCLGNEHRRLRSALNVGFTAAAVRSYQPVFRKVAEMVRADSPVAFLVILMFYFRDFGPVRGFSYNTDRYLLGDKSCDSFRNQ
jgi:cytochrome P450